MEQNRVRIADIAEALGISTATVSNVIHGKTAKISDATVKRVEQELEKTGYIPNMAGILLARNNSRIIGVVMNDHVKYEGRVLEDGFVMSSLNALSREANEKGYAEFTTVYGQHQQLSKEWFADLDLVADCAADAAAAWQGPALVIFGQDDEAVNPAVSARVAELLNAETFDGAGAGHGYGFYSEDPALRLKVADAVANFFAANLK